MNAVRKSFIFLFALITLFAFLYLPLHGLTLSNPLDPTKNHNPNNATDKPSSFLSEVSHAQGGLFNPDFKKTLDLGLRTYAWGQDRFGGFTKIGELKDNSGNTRAVAVGYGSVWAFNNASDTWSQGPSYSCNAEEDGRIAAAFFQNSLFLARIGIGDCGENFNAMNFWVFKFVNNVLTQTYFSGKLRSQRTAGEVGIILCQRATAVAPAAPTDTCNFERSNGAAYGPSMTVAGGALYVGFFRPTDDPNNDTGNHGKVVKVTGFNGNVPVMQIMCTSQGQDDVPQRFPILCRQIDNLTGAGNGQLFAIREEPRDWTWDPHIHRIVSLSTDPNNFNYVDTAIAYDTVYVDIMDSFTASDGRLRMAVGIFTPATFWSGGGCRNPQTHQIIIEGFLPDGGRGYSAYGTKTGGAVPDGKCNGGTGYIYNGGGFVETEGGKILFGFTYCAGTSTGNTSSNAKPVTACSDGTTGNAIIELYNGAWTGVDMRGSEIGNANYSDVRVTSMFYSATLRKLFAGIRNYPSIFGAVPNVVSRPGIWVQTYQPPIVNACSNLYFDGNPALTQGSVSPAKPNVSVTNIGTSTSAGGLGYIDILYNNTLYARKSVNGSVLNPTTGQYTMTVNFNLEADLKPLQTINATSVLVKVIIPGQVSYAPEAACTRVLTITPYSNPQVNNPNGGLSVTCSLDQPLNPYRIAFTIQGLPTANLPGAQVNKMRVIITPANDTKSTARNYYSFNASGVNTVATPYAIADNTTPVAFIGGNISNQSFTYQGSVAVFSFILNLDPNGSLYSQYYQVPGFRFATFVGDNTGRNNLLNGFGEVGSSSGVTSPLNQCSSLYYKTSNGDVRSTEPRAVSGVSSPYNKILRVTTNQGVNGQSDKDSRLRVSDYSYQGQGINTGFCSTYSRFGSTLSSQYCSSTSSSLGIAQIPALVTNLNAAMSNTSIKALTINGAQVSPWAVNNAANQSLDINIQSLPVASQSQIVLVKIQALPAGVSKVRILDPLNLASPDNVIIWCVATNCNLEVSPVTTTSNITLNTSNQIGYTTGATLNTFLLNKSRLYINTVPSGQTSLFSDVTTNNFVNIYNGAFITNNYFYTNNSTKTNVVKGFVYAKSIVAKGNGLSTTNDNLSITFRDFYDTATGTPKPLMYVDFDPKYYFVYRNLFVRPAESVPRNLVGT